MTAAPTPFDRLPTDRAAEVRAAAESAAREDGVAPLSEAFLLDLDRPGDRLLTLEEDRVVAAAVVAEDQSVEAFVLPAARGRGLGRALLGEALARHPGARLWAHGDLPAARALAGGLGLDVVRELLVLSRPVAPGDTDEVRLPEGYRSRPFIPGQDEEALLEVNAAAFADHPEQGSLDRRGLADRAEQPWFDPAGIILLEDGDPSRLAGFHWTKIDPPGGEVGEVYVVGVHPRLHGRGLGGPLTRLGLAHLARAGVSEVELYVEGDNTPALATYRRAGFTRKDAHVMYAEPDGMAG